MLNNYKYKQNEKFNKIFSVLVILILFSCSSDDGGGSTSGDHLVGKWKQVSQKVNGVVQDLNACELMETSEFKSNGTVLVDDYELVNGACILNSPNEPGLTIVIKWKKLADNSYELFFVANGVESPVKQSFTTAFSNGNNTVTVTTTEQDGSLVNSVLERL